MTCWFLIDDCTSKRSFSDTDRLDVTTRDEAIEEARRRWEALTPHDQAQRDSYYVCRGEFDDDGFLDYDSATDEYIIK